MIANNEAADVYSKDEIKELKRQIASLRAQLEVQELRACKLSGGNLLKSNSIDFYPGEQLDFVISILEQVKCKCPTNSRPYDIVASLLSLNSPIGRGQEILDEITKIFNKGDPSTEADINSLKSLGFTYTPSRKHPKLRFHEQYMFVLAGTPSDNRHGAKNKLSEINKCIAISQRI